MESNWIKTSVEQFTQLCNQLQEQVLSAQSGQLLEESEKLHEQFQCLLKQVQQQALQNKITSEMALPQNRICSVCSSRMRHKGKSSFEFIGRLGNIKLSGIYYRCACGQSKSVSEYVNSGRRLSNYARELVVRYGASFSYGQGEKFLRKDFGISLSDEFIRSETLKHAERIRTIRDDNSLKVSWPELEDNRLYGYVDGVLVHIIKEGWKECKLLRYDNINKQTRYRATLDNIDAFGKIVRSETIALGGSKAEEIVFLMDGAEGFHNHIDKNVPSAKQIIDYYHACQHIAQCADILYNGDIKGKKLWRKKYFHMLREKPTALILKSLRISFSRQKNKDYQEALRQLINYISKRQDRMNYPELLAQNYKVDSGPIESACKNVVQARMKMPGMRWSRKGAKAILEVRTALCSDIWEKILINAA